MLEPVIEYRNVCSQACRLPDRRRAIRADHDRNVRIESPVDEWLVLSIPAHDDRRATAMVVQPTRNPGGDRRFSAAANIHVANTDHRNRSGASLYPAGVVKQRPESGDASEDTLERHERRARRPGRSVFAKPDPLDHRDSSRACATAIALASSSVFSPASRELGASMTSGSP